MLVSPVSQYLSAPAGCQRPLVLLAAGVSSNPWRSSDSGADHLSKYFVGQVSTWNSGVLGDIININI